MTAEKLNKANEALERIFSRILALSKKDFSIEDFNDYATVKDALEDKKEEVKEPLWKVTVESHQGIVETHFFKWYTARDYIISALKKDPKAVVTLLNLPLSFPQNAKEGEWVVRFPLTDNGDLCGFDSYEKALAFFKSCVKANRWAEIFQC